MEFTCTSDTNIVPVVFFVKFWRQSYCIAFAFSFICDRKRFAVIHHGIQADLTVEMNALSIDLNDLVACFDPGLHCCGIFDHLFDDRKIRAAECHYNEGEYIAEDKICCGSCQNSGDPGSHWGVGKSVRRKILSLVFLQRVHAFKYTGAAKRKELQTEIRLSKPSSEKRGTESHIELIDANPAPPCHGKVTEFV